MTVQENSSLIRFYDILDEFQEGDPMDCVAEDVELDMAFPGRDDIAHDRFSGTKEDYDKFRLTLLSSHKPFRRNAEGTKRRHNVDTLVHVEGLEIMIGRGLGGTRNGTILSAAQSNAKGQLSKYAFAMSSKVDFSDPADRVTPEAGLIERFFDRLDGISMDDPFELLADDFQIEMVFPGIDGPPDERIAGDKAYFIQFMKELHERRPRKQVSQAERRHHVRTTLVVDGLDVFVGKALNGRRNGTVMAVAEADRAGKIRRFIAYMSPAVNFTDK